MAENKIGLNLGVNTKGITGINKFSNAMTNLSGKAKKVSTGFAGVQTRITKLNNKFTNITKDANRMSTSFNGVGKSLGRLNGLIGISSIYFLGRGLSRAVNSALDMIEVTNLFSVSLGDATSEANEFVSELSEIAGLDSTNIKSAIGTFALLSRSMGLNTEKARILSENIYTLGLDLSSLTNVPINQVMQDLRSGLVGQSETVYKYGLDVTEASLKQEAMNQGITKTVRNMSQGEKMALRYSVMIKNSSLAHGDFANTIETPANQLRILTERLTTLVRTMGTIFIPILAKTLPYVNALVKLMTTLFKTMASIFGYKPPVDSAGGLSGIEGGANDASEAIDGIAKAIKGVTTGIDELNILNMNVSGSSTSDLGVSVGDPNDFEFGSYESMISGIKSKTDDLFIDMEKNMNKMFSWIDKITKPIQIHIPALSDALLDTWEFLYEDILKPIASWTVGKALPEFLKTTGSAVELMGNLINKSLPKLKSFTEKFLKPLGEALGDISIEVLIELRKAIEELNKVLMGDKKFNDLSSGALFVGAMGGLLGLQLMVGTFSKLGGALAKTMVSLPATVTGLTALSKLTFPKLMLLAGAFAGGFKITDLLVNDGGPLEKQGDWIFEKFMEPWAQLFINGTYENEVSKDIQGFFNKVQYTWDTSLIGLSLKVLGKQISGMETKDTEPIIAKTKTFFDNFKTVWNNSFIGKPFNSIFETLFPPSDVSKMQEGSLEYIDSLESVGLVSAKEADAMRASFHAMYDGVSEKSNAVLPVIETGFTTTLSRMKQSASEQLPSINQTHLDMFKNMGLTTDVESEIILGKVESFLDGFEKQALEKKSPIATAFTSIFQSISDKLSPIFSDIGKGIEGFLEKVKEAQKESSKPIGVNIKGYSPNPNVNISSYARGGLIESGSIFQAGEAGSELLGNFGGKQTVMPLEDSGFVKAMADAVYGAMTSAQSNSGGNIEVIISEDAIGHSARRSMNKTSRQFGKGVLNV